MGVESDDVVPICEATSASAFDGATGIEPASEADRATAAKPEASAPWTQGEARLAPETLAQEGKREPEPPPRDPRGRAGCVDKRPSTEGECGPEEMTSTGLRFP